MVGKGRNQKFNNLLTSGEAAHYLNITERAVRKGCAKGRYQGAQKIQGNGGETWMIPVNSIPAHAQKTYYLALSNVEVASISNQFNQLQGMQQRADKIANEPSSKPTIASMQDHETRELWSAWENAPLKAKQKAELAMKALLAYENMRDSGIPKGEISKAIQEQFNIPPATLWRYRKAVSGQTRDVWAPLLIPQWKGRTTEAEFTPEAWEFIKQSWGSQSKPTLSYVVRQALKLATDRGWIIPSQDTVERRIRDLPPWWVALRRDGEKALAKLYPAQQRNYSTLRLHEIWCADGHKADVFCRWPDGSVSRPIIVAWIDLRSRVCLGYAVGKVESADLVRLAFKNAAQTCKAIPSAALVDNGRGFASKLLTGGTPNRYRFKVKEEDIPGILTILGIQVTWATPGHGQAKPIESWWRTLAQMAKRSEFRGAYCGNKPDAKPEEFDPSSVSPIETYLRILQEEISDYHQRPHRGDSMNGKSPSQIYDLLLPETAVRQPTAEQLRLCLLAAESIRLNSDHQIVLLENRYWTEQLADLRRP